MLPLTVERLRVRPPWRMVPLIRRGPHFPRMVSGKSVDIDPLTVEASTSMLALAGRSTVMPPLTVVSSSSPRQPVLPRRAVLLPFPGEAAARDGGSTAPD